MTHKKTHRVKRAARSAKTALSSIYKRMALVGKAGMARIRHLRANRSGYDHLAADEEDFAYIEKEAHDILAAIARLRARDAGEYPPEEAFYGPTAPSEAAEFYEPSPETMQEIYEPAPETMQDVANMTRGRRRRNSAGGLRAEKAFTIVKEGKKFGLYLNLDSVQLPRRKAESIASDLGITGPASVPIVKSPEGAFTFGHPSSPPSWVSKGDAKSLAHRLGRYMFNLGDFVSSYVEGY